MLVGVALHELDEPVTSCSLGGADVAMMASALLQNGPTRIAEVLTWMSDWMTERGYSSVDQLRGSVSTRNVPDQGVYERANYYQVLHSWQH